MNKKLAFKWASFIGDSEEYIGCYFDNKIVIHYVSTKVSLKQIKETAKCVEKLEDVQIALGPRYSKVFINGLTTPIQLTDTFDVGDDLNFYPVIDNGPTVQWLLDNNEVLSTFNHSTSKVLYTNNMAIQFIPYESDQDTITVVVLNTANIEDFLFMIEGSYIKWLDYKTFDAFLESYGYTDKAVNKNIMAAIMVYQAARELDFKSPESIAAHFYGKRLIADMTLRGVFGSLKPCWYE